MSFKRWNGSAWTDIADVKRHTGGAFTDCRSVKRWDGSRWADVWTGMYFTLGPLETVGSLAKHKIENGIYTASVEGGNYPLWAWLKLAPENAVQNLPASFDVTLDWTVTGTGYSVQKYGFAYGNTSGAYKGLKKPTTLDGISTFTYTYGGYAAGKETVGIVCHADKYGTFDEPLTVTVRSIKINGVQIPIKIV